jgi:hypothetical protein
MGTPIPKGNLKIAYRFRLDNGTERHIDVQLDAATFEFVPDDSQTPPAWTKLNFHQCENCPLGKDHEYCPVAVNIASVVDAFKDDLSYEQAEVIVETKERTYSKKIPLQKGLSSILGIIMPTSNCPVMDKLRPMAPFHLPFATPRETAYRVLSMFLVAQYFRKANGQSAEDSLEPLVEIYRAVSKVNKGMSKRLVEVTSNDASPNALVILHSLGDSLKYSVEENFDDLKSIFAMYLQSEDTGDSGNNPPSHDPAT